MALGVQLIRALANVPRPHTDPVAVDSNWPDAQEGPKGPEGSPCSRVDRLCGTTGDLVGSYKGGHMYAPIRPHPTGLELIIRPKCGKGCGEGTASVYYSAAA